MILTGEAIGRRSILRIPRPPGRPLEHVIAPRPWLGEALRPGFQKYAAQVVANAKALADAMVAGAVISFRRHDTH